MFNISSITFNILLVIYLYFHLQSKLQETSFVYLFVLGLGVIVLMFVGLYCKPTNNITNVLFEVLPSLTHFHEPFHVFAIDCGIYKPSCK